MKVIHTIFISLSLFGLWVHDGYGEKLYTWTDDRGEWHISQTPPPENVLLKDVINYKPRPVQSNGSPAPPMASPDNMAPDNKQTDERPLPAPATTDENIAVDVDRYDDPGLRREKARKKIEEELRDRPRTDDEGGVPGQKASKTPYSNKNPENNTVTQEDNAAGIRRKHHKR